MEPWPSVIKPGTSVSFSGCLHVQIISRRPAVPFLLFTLYAPIAFTITAFPKIICLTDQQKIIDFFLLILWMEGVVENWWGGEEERLFDSSFPDFCTFPSRLWPHQRKDWVELSHSDVKNSKCSCWYLQRNQQHSSCILGPTSFSPRAVGVVQWN